MASDSDCGVTLPEDLVFQILVWLPVASLLRFKSVCKAWLSHIDSSRFISQHTRRLDSSSEDNKLVVLNLANSSYFYYTFNFISVNDVQLLKYIEFSPSDYLHRSRLLFCSQLIASSHGIVCLDHYFSDGDEDVFGTDVISLWNPATTQFTTLPPGQSDIKRTEYGPNIYIKYGVGFDVKINDYKVVRVSFEYDGYKSFRNQVEVYSLSTGSWRLIDAVLPQDFIISDNPRQPFRNEIYCWCGYNHTSRRYLILSFDFSKEVFGIMPIPDACSNCSEYKLTLAYLKGKIAIICENILHRDQCEIWVLDKYGVNESWSNPYGKIMWEQEDQPMGFLDDEKVILIKWDDEQKLLLCDPLTREVNEVPKQGCVSEAAVYKESLISVKGATGVTMRVIYEDLSEKFQDIIEKAYTEDPGPDKIYLPEIRNNK